MYFEDWIVLIGMMALVPPGLAIETANGQTIDTVKHPKVEYVRTNGT